MTHRTHAHAAPLLALVAGLIAPMVRADSSPTTGETISFRFAPPPITYERRVATQRTRTTPDGAQQLDESTGTETVAISRTASGYIVRVSTTDLTTKRNGVEITNELLKSLQALDVTYQLDTEGRLVSVNGYEKVPELLGQIAPNLPDATKQALQQAFSTEALTARERAEYQGRIEDFLNLDVTLGTVSTGESSYALPTGQSIDFVNAIHFSDTKPCGNATCVVVDHYFNSDPSALPQSVLDVVTSLPTPADLEIDGGTMAIEGEVHRLIDPATMLIHHETVERTIRMTVETPGQEPTAMTLTERRTYEFDYPRPIAE